MKSKFFDVLSWIYTFDFTTCILSSDSIININKIKIRLKSHKYHSITTP